MCAALYSPDGGIEMIFGDPVELNHPEPFLESLRDGERKAASAVSSSGDGVILFGVPCGYPMSDGSDSLAIAVGLSTKYMDEVLFLDSDKSLSYSFVIRETAAMSSGTRGMSTRTISTGSAASSAGRRRRRSSTR